MCSPHFVYVGSPKYFMNKRAIQIVIALMSLALIGITIIQYTWLKRSVDLNTVSFNDKVTIALNKVHERLREKAKNRKNVSDYIHQNMGQSGLLKQDLDPVAEILSPGTDDFKRKNILYQNANMTGLLYPSIILEEINPGDLKKYIEEEMFNQNIRLKYDYGIYSFKDRSFSIINGHHVFQQEENSPASNVEENRSLTNSEYEVRLFGDAIEAPGALKVYFPSKTTYLWSDVYPSLISSILFTGLILFCFIYTINVILFQSKVSEMKTDFINNMTHEFKTPIATISLAADSIKSPMISGNPEKVNRFAKIIKEENKRMLGQVEKVLQMAQLEKSDFQLNTSEVNLHEIIKSASELARLKVSKRNGSVETFLKADQAIILADQNHVSNVIHNLLDNAEKYSKEKPEITISTKNLNDGIEVSVEDKGIGMSKEALKNIFEKFYRVHTGNLHDVKGFGLGLSYVKAIVNAHKGTINVTSELEKGSTFTLFLPFSSKESD